MHHLQEEGEGRHDDHYPHGDDDDRQQEDHEREDDNDIQVASVLEGSASKSDWAAIRRCAAMMMTVEIQK